MKIIVEGHEIETRNVWDIEHIENTREVKIIIKLTGNRTIEIGRRIPYETCTGQFQQYWTPYEKLYNSIKEKWMQDRDETPIFKL